MMVWLLIVEPDWRYDEYWNDVETFLFKYKREAIEFMHDRYGLNRKYELRKMKVQGHTTKTDA